MHECLSGEKAVGHCIRRTGMWLCWMNRNLLKKISLLVSGYWPRRRPQKAKESGGPAGEVDG